MNNVSVSDKIEGYVYVFPYDSKLVKCSGKIQYKCYESLKPIDVVKVTFKDYKEKYHIIESNNNKSHKI